MTEVCHAYEAGTPKTMVLPNRDYADGDFWGTQIFKDLESGASAWIYWNMILDEKGGPVVGVSDSRKSGSQCSAPGCNR